MLVRIADKSKAAMLPVQENYESIVL